MDVIQTLKDSNIRVVGNNVEIPHPTKIMEILQDYGDFSVSKLSGSTDGKNDDGSDIKLIDRYLLEVNTNSHGDSYNTIGIIVSQSGNFAKVYAGDVIFACTNLQISGAEYVREVKTIDVSFIANLIKKAHQYLPEQTRKIQEFNERLLKKTYSDDEFIAKKGELLSTISPNLFGYLNHCEEEFRNEKSLYYDMPNSDYKLLQGMTSKIIDSGITTRINKTLQLEKLFV